jgi:alpha-glucosidase
MANSFLWWQKGIIYQIYPRSYQDSNRDGIGDLPGIITRLDYVKSLNVDAIWLSPIYPSPMHDFGYDVSNYMDIHPMFGTLADFDRLLGATHERGMKLILDLVPNHTSDEHPWFIESRSSRNSSKRDWYIWRDPKPDGSPPNNWLSVFGGPAWTFDELTGQYYLHQFVKQQPDLNYRNPEVLNAMLDAMRFWLDRGIDGFRVDVIAMMVKDLYLRDNPPNPDWDGVNPSRSLIPLYSRNQPEVHDIVRKMRTLMDSYGETVMVGETFWPGEKLEFYGKDLDECQLPFNFDLIRVDWNARAVRQLVDQYEASLPKGAWPNWVLGNHDQPRVASRVGSRQARLANMLLLTLRGTPTVYYGEEIGMENVPIPKKYIQDPPAVNQPEIAHLVGRDPERTPMQWDSKPNAGFTDPGVTPWLPLAYDYRSRNVSRQETDPASKLHLFRALTNLRRIEPSLNVGDYDPVDVEDVDIFAYTRAAPGASRFLIVLNFGVSVHTLDLSRVAPRATIVVATHMQRSGLVDLSTLSISPDEGLVLRL